jgi:hypothetical protein
MGLGLASSQQNRLAAPRASDVQAANRRGRSTPTIAMLRQGQGALSSRLGRTAANNRYPEGLDVLACFGSPPHAVASSTGFSVACCKHHLPFIACVPQFSPLYLPHRSSAASSSAFGARVVPAGVRAGRAPRIHGAVVRRGQKIIISAVLVSRSKSPAGLVLIGVTDDTQPDFFEITTVAPIACTGGC